MTYGAWIDLKCASTDVESCFYDSLLRDVALGLARALDPAKQGQNDNLSIDRFVDTELPSDLRKFREKVIHVRNKRLSHNDLIVIMKRGSIAYGLTDIEVDEAFTRIVKILRTAEGQTSDGNKSDLLIDDGQIAAAKFLQKLRQQ